MRSTVTIEKDVLDRLLKETKSRSKAAAVKTAIDEYLRRRKIESIMSMKVKLEFDLSTDDIRHNDR
jgi:hypothetical protein